MLKIALALQANPEVEADSACRAARSLTSQAPMTSAAYAFSTPAALPRAASSALAGKAQTPPSSSDRGLPPRVQSATWSSKPNRSTLKETHLTQT